MKRNRNSEAPLLLLTISDVCRMVGTSRSTIYNWKSQGLFPNPVKLGPKRIGWHRAAIEQWAETREAA